MPNNPFDYCPICGVRFNKQRHRHRCNPKTLANIDATMKVDRIDQTGFPKTEGERLAYGFDLLAESDPENE